MPDAEQQTTPGAAAGRVRYGLFAVDLDGTLLDGTGQVPKENVEALDRLRAEGVRVVIATGRGLNECRHILERIGQTDPVIVAGGAITADPGSGETLHRFGMTSEMVERAVGRVHDAGHAALVLKDGHGAGFDYLVVGGERELSPDPVSVWWFEQMNARVRFAPSLLEDRYPELTIRVGVCADEPEALDLEDRFGGEFGGSATLHGFSISVDGERSGTGGPRRVRLVEIFDARAGKWSAVSRLAQELGIETARIAAIGDESNDVCMLRSAGLGIAMGNASEKAASAARVRTQANTELGFSRAVDRMLSGEW